MRSIASLDANTEIRKDLGDIDLLAESISRRGLISPIVITPDGQVLDGVRRLAAVKKLGQTQIPVRVVELGR